MVAIRLYAWARSMREVGRGQPMAERVSFCESVMWRRAGER